MAKEDGVSKAKLYNNVELKKRIHSLGNQQENSFQDSRIQRHESNQNAVIASLKRRIGNYQQGTKSWKEKIDSWKKERKAY